MITADPRFYHLMIVTPIVCLLPDLSMNLLQRIFFPEVEHTIIHMQAVLGDEPLMPKSSDSV